MHKNSIYKIPTRKLKKLSVAVLQVDKVKNLNTPQ